MFTTEVQHPDQQLAKIVAEGKKRGEYEVYVERGLGIALANQAADKQGVPRPKYAGSYTLIIDQDAFDKAQTALHLEWAKESGHACMTCGKITDGEFDNRDADGSYLIFGDGGGYAVCNKCATVEDVVYWVNNK